MVEARKTRTRRRRVAGYAGFVVLLLALTLATMSGASAGNRIWYGDPAGDSGTGVDIGAVQVVNDAAGRITFSVTVANRTELTADDYVNIFVDADANPATGTARGSDFVIGVSGRDQRYWLSRWDGTAWSRDVSSATLFGAYVPGGMSFTIHRSELGGTSQFSFSVGTYSYSQAGARDLTSTFLFQLLDYRSTGPVITWLHVGPPKAGKRFSVSFDMRRSETGRLIVEGAVRCRAKLGRVKLRGTWHLVLTPADVGEPYAVCVWRVPGGTRGKTLRGAITVVTEGGSTTRRFAERVR